MGCVQTVPVKHREQYGGCQDRVKKDPRPPDTFHQDYKLVHRLGKGAYAVVHSALHVHTMEVSAVKVMDLRENPNEGGGADSFKGLPDAKRLKGVEREVAMLRLVSNHQNVIGMLGLYVEDCIGYIVMEKCDSTLLMVLERAPQLTESVLRHCFFEGMLSGIQAIHSKCVAHRDIKPDNFLCRGPNNTVKLCDFGLASSTVEETAPPRLKGVYGTPPFMAPEMLRGEHYGMKIDVWSFGVIMFMLFFGKFPYKPAKQTGMAMKGAILAGEPAPTFQPVQSLAVSAGGEVVSKEAVELVRSLLSRDPSDRPNAAQVMSTQFFSTAAAAQKDEVSLRPALFAAKRIGGFDVHHTGKPAKSDLDVQLAWLQKEARHSIVPERCFDATSPDQLSAQLKQCSPRMPENHAR